MQLSLWARAQRKAGRISRYARMLLDYCGTSPAARPRPIFVVCQNRTGSTFLNQLFGAHPQCWTYGEGSHQEAMRHEDCPRWLSGQAFQVRWRITRCPWLQRLQTRVWLAAMARAYPYGVFKIPHALAKVRAIQELVPHTQFVLLVRHPAAQVGSALATGNPLANLEITADVLTRFLETERQHVRNLHVIRYEDLLADPEAAFGGLCSGLGLDGSPTTIRQCIEAVGVRPGKYTESREIPLAMQRRVQRLCELLGYEAEAACESPVLAGASAFLPTKW